MKFVSMLAVGLIVSVTATCLQAQITIQAMGSDDGGPTAIYSFSSDSMAPMGLPPMMGLGSHVPSDSMGMLRLPQFEKELELVEDQLQQIRELQQEMQKKTGEIFRSSAQLGGGSDMGQIMREAQKAIREQTEQKLAQILLPHQMKRMKQLKVQLLLRNQGARALTGDEMAAALKITDEQKAELAEKQREAQKTLQKKIQQLREQMQRDVMEDVLTPQQLKKLEQLSGDKYDVQKPDYQSIFSRRRQPSGEKKKE